MTEGTQEYLVLVQIGGAGDPEVWQPGSKIRLDLESARAHLRSGNVRVIETTGPIPEISITPVVPITEEVVVVEVQFSKTPTTKKVRESEE